MIQVRDPAMLGQAGSDETDAASTPALRLPVKSPDLRNHPLRHVLNNELHARPFVALRPPECVSYLALHTGEQSAGSDHTALMRLCERYGVTPPQSGVNHFAQDFGPFRLKWERHTEFVTYAFFRHGGIDEPFRAPVIEEVARDWLDRLPGSVLVAVHVAMLPRDAAPPTPHDLERQFKAETVVGSRVASGAATVFTDYRIHADGFSRLLIRDLSLSEHQGGRLVQRLLEIEAYRMMALLAFPLARETAPEIAHGESDLAEITARLAASDGPAEERGLLDRLVQLAGSLERLRAATSYRFRAARAYHALVERRLQELREERMPGLQTMSEFMERRLLPAMRTCSATEDRLESLSLRVARASELLRTRVDITIAEQNRNLLLSMDRRARLQLLLHEMVEGLSVVAITYYGLGLLGYVVHGLKPLRLGIEDEVFIAASAPVIFAAVWLALRHFRRRRLRQTER
jgi:uncharacterized membrane-anchored protein